MVVLRIRQEWPGRVPAKNDRRNPRGGPANSRIRALCCGVALLLPVLLMTGCAALLPFSSLIGNPQGSGPSVQVHEQTSVNLAADNFVVVKTNVMGESLGFSLLGLITIYPATLTKAMSRMYASAQIEPGQPQTLAHLIVERSSSYWILFGLPKVEVRSDIVAFRPAVKNGGSGIGPTNVPPARVASPGNPQASR